MAVMPASAAAAAVTCTGEPVVVPVAGEQTFTPKTDAVQLGGRGDGVGEGLGFGVGEGVGLGVGAGGLAAVDRSLIAGAVAAFAGKLLTPSAVSIVRSML